MITFLHGTISFRQGDSVIRGWFYELEGRFIDGVGPNVPIFDLDRLQRQQNGDLDIERLPDGSMRMRKSIVAHGAESACRQAADLSSALRRFVGFKTNVAHCAQA